MGALAADRLCKSQAEGERGMSNRNKIYSKGRIPGQWTALRCEAIDATEQFMVGYPRNGRLRWARPQLVSPVIDHDGNFLNLCRKAAMEVIRGRERGCGQEIRGQARRGGTPLIDSTS